MKNLPDVFLILAFVAAVSACASTYEKHRSDARDFYARPYEILVR